MCQYLHPVARHPVSAVGIGHYELCSVLQVHRSHADLVVTELTVPTENYGVHVIFQLGSLKLPTESESEVEHVNRSWS